ncbi:MAG: DUF433 domain-containing protein [Leptolyngbyaceae cyanobacterium RU_5_1]|nr:DUF433 domain-containing protein [Leptolyngbyaceae cyanobacterium RU_5_1]
MTNYSCRSTSRYVTRDSEILQGEPIIVGTKVAVRDIVKLWKLGVKPEDVSQKLMGLVTAAQVFDAISFYLDNQSEVDDYIELYQKNPLWEAPLWLKFNAFIEIC